MFGSAQASRRLLVERPRQVVVGLTMALPLLRRVPLRRLSSPAHDPGFCPLPSQVGDGGQSRRRGMTGKEGEWLLHLIQIPSQAGGGEKVSVQTEKGAIRPEGVHKTSPSGARGRRRLSCINMGAGALVTHRQVPGTSSGLQSHLRDLTQPWILLVSWVSHTSALSPHCYHEQAYVKKKTPNTTKMKLLIRVVYHFQILFFLASNRLPSTQ